MNEKTPTEIGLRVAKRINFLGVRPAAVAREAGMSRAAVAHWANGGCRNLAMRNLFPVAKALRCSPRWLATGEGPEEEEEKREFSQPVQRLAHAASALTDDQVGVLSMIASSMAGGVGRTNFAVALDDDERILLGVLRGNALARRVLMAAARAFEGET